VLIGVILANQLVKPLSLLTGAARAVAAAICSAGRRLVGQTR